MARIGTLVVVLGLFVALSLATTSDYSLFRRFIQKHNKSYSSADYLHRFNVFKDNLKIIDDLNERAKTAKFGVTKFSDLTQEEFKRMYLGTKPFTRDPSWPMLPELSAEELAAAPTTWDWRDHGAVTGVKVITHKKHIVLIEFCV